MSFLFSYIKPRKWRMIRGLTVKVVATFIELLLPMMLTYMLETVIKKAKISDIIIFGSLMLVFSILTWMLNIYANRQASKVSVEIAGDLRSDLFEKTLNLSARQTDKFTVASLESRITSDTYNIHHFLNMMQRMGVRAPILLIGGVTISLIMDSVLALAMLATLPLIFVIVYFISRHGTPLYSKAQTSVDSMVRVVREDSQGIRVIKALSKNEYENRRFAQCNEQLSKDERKASIIMGIPTPVMTLLMNLGICAVIALSAIRVSKNLSSPATVIAFMQYFTLISMAMMTLSRIFVMMTKCIASSKRVAEVMASPEEYIVKLMEEEKLDTDAYIRFENVNFSYLGKRSNLKNVNFDLPKGANLGIIGATGSGKTTLIKLLMNFYEIDSGRILIDGRDIRSYSREEFSSLFGVAFQNDFLFADTILENIKLGRDISDEDVYSAAKTAQAHEFIMEIPDGYSHLLSPGGTNLSGGQKQRLLITRALAAHPPILILDDSSSALDYKTDALLREALRRDFADTTVVTIAQRVSSVMSSDMILVLEDGVIIGAGTHDELLANCPEYKEISDSQMGGAFVE